MLEGEQEDENFEAGQGEEIFNQDLVIATPANQPDFGYRVIYIHLLSLSIILIYLLFFLANK